MSYEPREKAGRFFTVAILMWLSHDSGKTGDIPMLIVACWFGIFIAYSWSTEDPS